MFIKFLTCLLFPAIALNTYETSQAESKPKEESPHYQTKVVDSIKSFYSPSVIYLDINSANDLEFYISSEDQNVTQTIFVKR